MKSYLSSIAIALLVASPLRATPPLAPVGGWNGAAGLPGSTMVPDPAAVPAQFFEEGIAGRLQMTFAKPTRQSPRGSYSAQFVLFHGNRTFTYRHSAPLTGNTSLSGIWSAKDAPPLSISLARSAMAPSADFFVGEVSVGASTHPVFLLPQRLHSKNPMPSGTDGAQSLFLENIAIGSGIGFGSASISRTGTVKIAATLPDGTKATSSTDILFGGSTPFFVVAGPAGKSGFLGGWAKRDPSSPDSDWSGHAKLSAFIPSARFFLSAYSRPAGTPLFPTASAMLDLQMNPDFFIANGRVAYDARKSTFRPPAGNTLDGANAYSVALQTLSLNPANGLATGSVTYFYISSPTVPARRETAFLTGILNRKTGEILGRTAAKRSVSVSGPLLVTPIR